MNSPKDYLTDRVKEIIGFNDRGIVEYWEERQYAKCTNCGAKIKGKKAKDWMFGHVGCPKPNGYFIRNDTTPQKIMDVIEQSMEVGREKERERIEKEIKREWEMLHSPRFGCPFCGKDLCDCQGANKTLIRLLKSLSPKL